MALFGDNSKRTKTVQRYVITVIVSLTIFVLAIPMIFVGRSRYFTKVERSSTAIGTTLSFPKSNSQLTLRGLYTDKNQEVLVVRLHPENQNIGSLPSKGTSYAVSISNKQLDNAKTYPILFDKVTLDGDFLLVIPKPNEDVYTIFIANNVDNLDILGDAPQANAIDSTKSIQEAIAGFEVTSDGVTQKTASNSNVMSFRVALKPYLKGDEYKVTELDTQLVKDGEFDIASAYTSIFVDPVTKNTTKLIEDAQKEVDKMTKQQTQWKNELSENAIEVLNKELLARNGNEVEEDEAEDSATSAILGENTDLSNYEKEVITNIIASEDKKQKIEDNIAKLGQQLISVQKASSNAELFQNTLTEAGVLSTQYLEEANKAVEGQQKK